MWPNPQFPWIWSHLLKKSSMEKHHFLFSDGGYDFDFETICCFLNMAAESMTQYSFDKPLVRNVTIVVAEQNMVNAAVDLKKVNLML